MKVLVLGAKGFIGSHLVAYFKSKGNEVISCDVKSCPDEPNYYSVQRTDSDYSVLFENHKPDACIYAGGNGSVPLSLEQPELDYHLNVNNVFSILQTISIYHPRCKFIHLSSAAVYGNPASLPISEDAVIKPLSPYGWHKYLAELVCKEFYELKKIPTCSLRIFSVYGEGLRKQLFWDIYKKSQNTNKLELFGTGQESRDFIYIQDLSFAIDCILSSASFQGESINVASGIETEIKEAALSFLSHYKPSASLQFNQHTKPGDPNNWRADITKLKSFGFEYSISLHNGLLQYSQWLKENESL